MEKIITKIKYTAAIFTVNFKQAKKQLKEQLKDYDVIVTADTVKDAKILATDLNKQAADLNVRRKEAVFEVSGPIRTFETEMNELVAMCKDGREKILSQVQKFEDETRAEVELLLDGLRGGLWHELQVKNEFQKAKISDLVILTSMTATGKLTGKATAEVKSRVTQDKAKQVTIEMRLISLENACYKAGLKSPLTEEHVQSFLLDDDQTYNARLSALIHVEVKRQEETVQKVTQDVVKTTAVSAINSVPIIDTEAPVETKVKKVVESSAPDRIIWDVSIQLKVETPESVSPERIEARLRRVLEDAGIKPEAIQVNKQ